jgi:hypothetical protein
MATGRKTGGRQKGTPNKATVEARVFCGGIIDDPAYQSKLRRRAIAGTLSPAIEALLWHYAKGKPKDYVELSTDAALIARLDRGRERNAKGLADRDRSERAGP